MDVVEIMSIVLCVTGILLIAFVVVSWVAAWTLVKLYRRVDREEAPGFADTKGREA